jgi:hypothetical protein
MRWTDLLKEKNMISTELLRKTGYFIDVEFVDLSHAVILSLLFFNLIQLTPKRIAKFVMNINVSFVFLWLIFLTLIKRVNIILYLSASKY